MRRTLLLKLAVGLIALALFGVLFIRSVRNTGAAPYTMKRSDLAGFLTSEEPWLRHFHEHASPELRQVLSDARRAWVIGEVRAWMRTHDLPEYRFVRSSRPSAAAPRGPRAPRPRVVALREALHRAIDRMSERELEALGVPARLLVED